MDTLIVIVSLCGSLLIIFGGLLGHSLTQRLMASELRRRAELGREIGEQWRELVAERERRGLSCCPRCGRSPLEERTEKSRMSA